MKKIIALSLVIFFLDLYAGNLRIGTIGYNPPFEMQINSQGEMAGFDIALMNEICKRMQITCHYQSFSFERLFAAVKNESIDLAIGSINISLNREKNFLFSIAYLPSFGNYIINSNSKISEDSDLKGKKIGLVRGSVYKDFLLKKFNNNIKIIDYSLPYDIFAALSKKKVDAIVTDHYAADYWIANNHQYSTIKGEINYGLGYGIMTNKNQIPLMHRINMHLTEILADGTFNKLYKQYLSFEF